MGKIRKWAAWKRDNRAHGVLPLDRRPAGARRVRRTAVVTPLKPARQWVKQGPNVESFDD